METRMRYRISFYRYYILALEIVYTGVDRSYGGSQVSDGNREERSLMCLSRLGVDPRQ